ncbi:hypothetical protein BFP70_19620 [Thioclava sp. SK-1]|uniref:flavodoxin n=1 Tax=Thioclava sp. SK-1 TaxID=1889770 RepID=UPI000824CED7|nr:flavodoxin [Thioclava sp. SK-1]OCX56625.1 hypothetical protein BFP70_19620 [Thioclava sp. SK-1]
MPSLPFSRRLMLAALTLLPLASRTKAQDSTAAPDLSGRVLVVLYTRSHNSRIPAELVRRRTGGDLFEIRTRDPYPIDYFETVEQVTREREVGYRPPLDGEVADIAGYDTIVLAFPIWGGSLPPPVRSFLDAHDLGGKRLVPMICHGGYGPGEAMALLRAAAPEVEVTAPFVMEGEQERRVVNRVDDWLGG